MNLRKTSVRRIAAATAVLTSVFICIFSLNFYADAAASDAVSSISIGKSSYNIGDTFTATVTVSAKSVESIEGRIKYDPSVIEFVSSDDANGTEGILTLSKWNTGKKSLNSISSKISFKAKSAGKCRISFDLTEVCDSSLNQINASGSSTDVSVKGSDDLSGNADLKSISVSGGTLTPAFSADVTEYSVTVPNTVTRSVVSAEPVDNNAKIALSGSSELKVGNTRRAITVTAPNGTQKSYIVNFNRLDKKGESVSKVYDDTGISSANRNDNDSSESLNSSTHSAVGSAPHSDSSGNSGSTSGSGSLKSEAKNSNSALIAVLSVACAVLLIALITVIIIAKKKSADDVEKMCNRRDNQTDKNDDKGSEDDEN